MKIYVRNRGAPKTRTQDRLPLPELEEVGVFRSTPIGPKRSKTPQGYLLCQDVPIARTGTMFYGAGEVPVSTGPEGWITVERGEEELFNPITMSSFVAMPVTDEHPPDGDVSPATWRERAYGFVLNVRKGEGENADCLVCDLMITDPQMIQDIDSGKREVSAGYDAGYIEVAPGRGYQVRIMGNHVALVERGRCGPRCAIGDSATVKQGKTMPTITRKPGAVRRPVVNAAMRKRILDAAEEAIDQAMADPANLTDDEEPVDTGGDGHTHIHLHMGGTGDPAGAAPAAAGAAAPGASDGSAPAVVGDDNAGATAPVATPEDRLTALETGMQQILNAIKPLVEGAAAPATGAPPGAPAVPPAGPKAADSETPPGDAPPPAAAKKPDESAEPPKPAPTEDNAMEEEEEELVAKSGNTMDSESLSTTHAAMKSMAEVLFPGFQFPAFDPKAPRKTTQDSLCSARRRCLDMAYSTAAGRQIVDTLRGTTKTLDVATMPCTQCGLMFRAAAGAMKLVKTRDTIGDLTIPPQNAPKGPTIGTAAWIDAQNAAAKKFWADRQPAVTK